MKINHMRQTGMYSILHIRTFRKYTDTTLQLLMFSENYNTKLDHQTQCTYINLMYTVFLIPIMSPIYPP
jgi:hypothetical protein